MLIVGLQPNERPFSEQATFNPTLDKVCVQRLYDLDDEIKGACYTYVIP